jgi:hypothetical protein
MELYQSGHWPVSAPPGQSGIGGEPHKSVLDAPGVAVTA